jgi:hypothetical protein
MKVAQGDDVILFIKGEGYVSIEVEDERTTEEVRQLVKADLRKTNPKDPSRSDTKSLGVLRELNSFAWLITSGNRAYIYDGHPDGFPIAKKLVEQSPENAGNVVKTKELIK